MPQFLQAGLDPLWLRVLSHRHPRVVRKTCCICRFGEFMVSSRTEIFRDSLSSRRLLQWAGLLIVAIILLSAWESARGADMIKPVAVETAPSPKPLESGLDVGDYVPTFYSRVVSGSLMNKSVCFVCRSGRRPVVMILMRDIKREYRPLIKNISRLVDMNRGSGMRGFGVMISENPFGSISKVQTFAFNNKISMPLTVAPLSVAGPSCQDIHPDAEISVVLYRNREVVKTISFRAGELTYDRSRDVIDEVRTFIARQTSPPLKTVAASAGE